MPKPTNIVSSVWVVFFNAVSDPTVYNIDILYCMLTGFWTDKSIQGRKSIGTIIQLDQLIDFTKKDKMIEHGGV